jgi:putative ABC transport system permease protein
MVQLRLRPILRVLWRDRAVTGMAFAILALGIGASTALFTVVNAVLLTPLPYPATDRLHVIRVTGDDFSASYPSLPANAMHVAAWQRDCRVCEGVAALGSFTSTIAGNGDSEQLDGLALSAGALELLGIAPVIGRGFTSDEDREGAAPVVMLGEGVWRRRFGSDPRIVGRAVQLDGRAATVVGVVPAAAPIPGPEQLGNLVRLPQRPDLFRPLAFSRGQLESPGDFDFGVVARLRPGVTARAAMDALESIEATLPSRPGRGVLHPLVISLQDVVVRQARTPLWILMGTTGGLLLIVCVNLANLLLARHAGRRRDAAIRSALGAERRALMADSLVESAVLAGAGGLAGLLISTVMTRALLAAAPSTLPRLNAIALDASVAMFVVAITAATAVLVGILPAIRIARVEAGDVLKSGSYTTTEGAGSGRTRRALVASQSALAALVLVATGLLVASFVGILHVNKGFASTGALIVDVALPPSGYLDAVAQHLYIQRALEAAGALPGVTAVAATNRVPLRGEAVVNPLSFEHDVRPFEQRPMANYRYVTPDYFTAIGTPLLEGRTFRESDRGRQVVVLSASAAKALWPEGGALGRSVKTSGQWGAVSEVIGIAADTRAVDLVRTDIHFAYLPYWLRPAASVSFVLKGQADPATVRATLQQLDRAVPIVRIETMDEILARSVADRRFALTLMLQFGAAAALLAALGAYGIVAYSVARRARELGIRVALGAAPSDVRRLVLSEGLLPVVVGTAVGLVLSLALGGLMASALFEVRAGDPRVLAGAAFILLASAAVACLGPLRRAARTNAAVVLR